MRNSARPLQQIRYLYCFYRTDISLNKAGKIDKASIFVNPIACHPNGVIYGRENNKDLTYSMLFSRALCSTSEKFSIRGLLLSSLFITMQKSLIVIVIAEILFCLYLSNHNCILINAIWIYEVWILFIFFILLYCLLEIDSSNVGGVGPLLEYEKRIVMGELVGGDSFQVWVTALLYQWCLWADSIIGWSEISLIVTTDRITSSTTKALWRARGAWRWLPIG